MSEKSNIYLKGQTFEGKPCIKCDNTTRYVKNKMCVVCHRINIKNWKQTEKGKAYEKIIRRKQSDLKLYGACADAEKTKRRREIEERALTKAEEKYNL